MNATEKELIYREVTLQYTIEDAKQHTADYMEFSEINCDLSVGDYEQMANLFLLGHDCNLSDNMQWDNIVANYLKEKLKPQKRKLEGIQTIDAGIPPTTDCVEVTDDMRFDWYKPRNQEEINKISCEYGVTIDTNKILVGTGWICIEVYRDGDCFVYYLNEIINEVTSFLRQFGLPLENKEELLC